MEFKTVYNDARVDPKVTQGQGEQQFRENFVRVAVYSPQDQTSYSPSLIKVTHGFNQVEDWSTRWILASGNREKAIRYAIQILDVYKLGCLCSDMVGWHELHHIHARIA